jgi:signal transduction histidine kinase
MRLNRRFILFVPLIAYFFSFSQTDRIDSLRKKLYAARSDEEKLLAYLDLAEEYPSLNRDSFDVYGPVIKELAMRSRNPMQKSLAELAYANWYYRWGWSDSALVFIEPELAKNPVDEPATRDIYFKLARAKAMYLGSKSRYAEALEVLYRLLSAAEKYRDTSTIGLSCNTIGSVEIARKLPQQGLGWIKRAISIGSNRIEVLAPAYINAGYAYASIGKSDSAEFYINKGLPLCRQLQNLHYIATALRIQTNIYTSLRRYADAEKALLEMMAIRQKLSSASILVEDNLQLAEFYANSGQLSKAIEICKNNLKKGNIVSAGNGTAEVFTNDPKVRVTFLEKLAAYYKQAGDMNEYYVSLEELVSAKDSLYAANSAEAIAELQTKYEVQKKENTILQQKFDLQRKNFLFYGSLALTILLLVTGFILFSTYKKRQKTRVAMLMEEERKQAQERERVRIASDLHDNLGAYAASMASNIGYIHVPDADEKTRNALQELSNNSGAIISQLNDTIWALKKDELSLTAISDRIKSFISRIRKSYPDISIDVEENISNDVLLPSFQAFHLYRILQEAINNALKHSRAKNIVVNIDAGNSWEVNIRDDGRGFVFEEVIGNSGNGLAHMMERSREVKWKISWEKTNPSGTLVKISPTTN